MTDRYPRLAGLLLVSLAVAACGSTSPSPSRPPDPTAVASSAPSALPTIEPSAPAPEPTPPATAGQTDTDWGRIWDRLPAGFPMYPGALLSEEALSEPASAFYVVDDAEPGALATWFQEAFELAAYHTDALSGPFEDGGYLLESSGDDAACRVSLTIAPLGGTTSLTVLYGAACPHD